MTGLLRAAFSRGKELKDLSYWNDGAVIRAPVFDVARLQQHATTLAESHHVTGHGVGHRRLRHEMLRNRERLMLARDFLLNAVNSGEAITPAGEWLVDNFHTIDQHTQQAIEDLPSGYYRKLPKITQGHLAGRPRVMSLAWAFLAHTDSDVSTQALGDFVNAYQSVAILRIGELWALPIHLRILLIENAARIATRTIESHAARVAATQSAETLTSGNAGLEGVLTSLDRHAGHARLSYIVELHRRVHGKFAFGKDVIGRLEAAAGAPIGDLIALSHDEHARQVANNVSMQNIFTSLKLVGENDWEAWFQTVSVVDATLSKSSGFPLLDKQSRSLYRRAVEDLAENTGIAEDEIARRAVVQSDRKDVGFLLIGSDRGAFEADLDYRRRIVRVLGDLTRGVGLAGYLAMAFALAAVITLIGANAMMSAGVGTGVVAALSLLILVLAMDAALAMVNYAVTQLMKPVVLPAVDFSRAIPDDHQTIIAIPVLISSFHGVDEMLDRIEGHYLSNDDASLFYALVSDWPDAQSESMPDDDALLARLTQGIAALNRKHDHERFMVFHRRRLWNSGQGVWMGWERKRGKLHELNRILRGAEDTSFVVTPKSIPRGVQHVIVLDSDTLLPRGAAACLVGKMAHPINAPVLDPASKRITRGYGILQPRVATLLPDQGLGSEYFNLAASRPGIDPYVFASSDVYQDLFGEGTFTGKGLYNIDAFEAAVAGRVAENELLSHDLFEGNFARAALVSDVEVAEDFPDRYVVDMARHHRWTRGDWQLLPWMFPRTPGLSWLGWWKMFDNLRRSLNPLFVVLGLLAGWLLLPARSAATWTVLVLAVQFVPSFLPVFGGSSMSREAITVASEIRSFLDDLVRALRLTALRVAFSAHQSVVMLDAIVRSLYRLSVSRRNLLEWTTAAQLQGSLRPDLAGTYRLMWPSAAIGVAVIALAFFAGGGIAAAGIPFGVLWALAPGIAFLISKPRRDTAETGATPQQLTSLRAIALRTWRFFDVHVVASENWLPPDNLQVDPFPVVAHRTSPTNIGLYMLSTVSAYDIGWIGLNEAAQRLQSTLDTMDRMTAVRGHLFNWYDTLSLAPLEPRYISTVDSGNLAAHLIAVANACETWRMDVGANPGHLTGLADIASLIRDQVTETRKAHRDAAPQADRMTGEIDALIRGIEELRNRPDLVLLRIMSIIAHIKRLTQSLQVMWERLDYSGQEEGEYYGALLNRAAEAFFADATRDMAGHERIAAQLQEIAGRCREFAYGMDFAFLVNRQRGLLSIGYRVSDETLDGSCYDMLASEAALTNFLAVATSDGSGRMWSKLGRSIVAVDNRACLLSWSGSMFEYLMPLLVLHAPDGTLYRQTMSLAVRRHQAYAATRGVPWGISESAYTGRDRHLTYQYSSFGVPSLGLKRGLDDDLVVAPYATGLAAMVAPGDAARNFTKLLAYGALGRFGYYEAIDFTVSRLRPNERFEVIRAHFAHHQGMTITAIHNAVSGGALRRYFHRENSVRAAQLLLQERAPTYLPTKTIQSNNSVATVSRRGPPGVAARLVEPRRNAAPRTALYSNGRLSLMLTATGQGYLRWNGVAVNRWREDPLRGEGGLFIALRNTQSGEIWPAVAWEMGEDPPEHAIFNQEKAEFRRTDRGVSTHVECLLTSEHDIEVRSVELVNATDTAQRIEVTGYSELALARQDADESHPAFSKLFVYTEHDPQHDALIATRRKRLENDPDIWVAHFVVSADASARPEYDTSRETFLGRGGTLKTAVSQHAGKPLAQRTGDVLDPVFVTRRTLELPPHRSRKVLFFTATAASREALVDIVGNYRNASALERIQVNCWTQSRVLLHHYGLDAAEADLFQDLATALVYSRPTYRPPSEFIAAALQPQQSLWGLSISGTRPIVAVKIARDSAAGFIERILRAQDYWAEKGLAADVVVINLQPASYAQDLQTTLDRIVAREHTNRSPSGRLDGGIFLVKAGTTDRATIDAILASARVVLAADDGTLEDQVVIPVVPWRDPRSSAGIAAPVSQSAQGTTGLSFHNGFGGFDLDSGEYVITHRRGTRLPAPWINVIANPDFGVHCSAEGGGYSWYRNSKEMQLTCWSNDPLIDRPSEVFYVLDTASRRLLSPTVDPLGSRGGAFETRHGFGYTRYDAVEDDVAMRLTVTVDPVKPIKRSKLDITNTGSRGKRLIVTFYAEVALGKSRSSSAHFITSEWQADRRALVLRNVWNADLGGAAVFASFGEAATSWTADRGNVFGAGTLQRPIPVANGLALGRQTGGGLDPCIAIQAELTVAAGASGSLVLDFGVLAPDGHTEPGVMGSFDETLAAQRNQWADILGRVKVRSPDPSFDIMMNGWLLYQSLSCRFWGRSGFYQASGAYGFRDQLQDSMAIAYARPELTRRHILRAASRQFVEGDVQHWWLPDSGAGVRTHISDDTCWLAYCTAHYMRITGDSGILDEQVGFLEGAELPMEQHDRFFIPAASAERATLYEHCVRGIARALGTGAHGLPLMGTGDWNDGMNKVGEHGRGESVWLGWMLCSVLGMFADIARTRGDTSHAEEWTLRRASLADALDKEAWDGNWYRRAYFDDGTPLGTAESSECRIDAIAQSWAVLSKAADPAKAKLAMESVDRLLIDREAGIAHLFLPPLEHHEPAAGYIQSYPPGVRENGGQYTHGALWAIFAFAALGDADRAHALFSMINPVNHARDMEAARTYGVEPYVIAADIYSHGAYRGRGGWTWYTGAAGWAYRAGLEAILGIQLRGKRLHVVPRIPSSWPDCSVEFRHDGKRITLSYVRTPKSDAPSGIDFDLDEHKDGDTVAVRIP